jgi:hypothetical protein
MLSSLKQTVFAMIFLMSETPPDAPLKSTRAQFVSIVLMVIDFLQVRAWLYCSKEMFV